MKNTSIGSDIRIFERSDFKGSRAAQSNGASLRVLFPSFPYCGTLHPPTAGWFIRSRKMGQIEWQGLGIAHELKIIFV